MFTLTTILFLILVIHNFLTEKRLRVLESRIAQIENKHPVS